MKHSRLTECQRDALLKLFVAGATARTAAALVPVHRNTAAFFFTRLRRLLADHERGQLTRAFEGKVTLDLRSLESRDEAGQVPVCGILHRGGRIFVVMCIDHQEAERRPTRRQQVVPDSVVYAGGELSEWRVSVEGWACVRGRRRRRGSGGRGGLTVVDSFWRQAKRHLQRHNGVPHAALGLFLHECAWRFNTPGAARQLRALRRLLHES